MTQASNLTGIVYPAAAGKLNAVYDVLNRQTKVQSPSGLAAYFFYDAASNLTRKDLGNKSKYFVEYDLAERISKWKTSKANNGALSYFEYTRDAKGLITKSFRNHLATSYYEYDSNDRLVSELWRYNGVAEVYAFRYAYDSAGNRIRARIKNNAGAAANTYYFYDQANQLKVRGTNAVYASPTYYFYDKNGSVTSIKEPTRASYFAYNSAGLLARIRWGDASSTYFLYDGNLQRYGMQTGTTSMTTTYFLWDGPNLLQELNSNGTVKEEHTNIQTPIPGIGQLVETNRPGQAQAKLFPIMDPRGSITKWMQSDGNTIFASREYDAFGNILFRSETGTWPGRQGYQGQWWQEILSNNGQQRFGLTHTRVCDFATGRFLQNEPRLELRPLAHFLYANQNPVNLIDPTGLTSIWETIAKIVGKKGCPETLKRAGKALARELLEKLSRYHPDDLKAKEILAELKKAGWIEEVLGKGSKKGKSIAEGGGLILRDPSTPDAMLEWYPGGPHHPEGPHWKFSSGASETLRTTQTIGEVIDKHGKIVTVVLGGIEIAGKIAAPYTSDAVAKLEQGATVTQSDILIAAGKDVVDAVSPVPIVDKVEVIASLDPGKIKEAAKQDLETLKAGAKIAYVLTSPIGMVNWMMQYFGLKK